MNAMTTETETPDRLQLYRIDDVCRVLGCHRRTLEQHRAAGRFPRPDCHVGDSPRWKRSTLEAWIAEGGSR